MPETIISNVVNVYVSIIVGIISTMCSGIFVTIGKHRGKIRFGNEWASFWRLLGGLLLEIVFLSVYFLYLYPFAESVLSKTLPYSIGVSSGVIGVFTIWFAYAFDFDITEKRRWIAPVVCFVITTLNVLVVLYWTEILRAFGLG